MESFEFQVFSIRFKYHLSVRLKLGVKVKYFKTLIDELIGILWVIPFLNFEREFFVNNKESVVEMVFFVFIPY